MKFKKTFWMNVILAITFIFFSLFGLIGSGIEVFNFLARLFTLATSIITAVHLYKSNTQSLRNFSLFGNYCNIILLIGYLLTSAYSQPTVFTSMNFLIYLFVYIIIILPFAVNLKALRNSYV